MAQIPSWLWLFAGIIVTAGSYYVKGNIALFFYLGLLFILIGVAKIIFWFIMRKPKTGKIQMPMPQSRAQPVQQAAYGNYKKCMCGRFVRLTDNFCWACGRRLR
ncbi:MAG: hypothetical protein QW666_02615 [Candidatus Woesearchaeota archaeon]